MAHGPEELAWLRRRKQAEAAAEAGVPAAVPGAGWGLHHAAGDAASTTSSAGSSAAGFRTDHQTRTVPCRYFRQGYCRVSERHALLAPLAWKRLGACVCLCLGDAPPADCAAAASRHPASSHTPFSLLTTAAAQKGNYCTFSHEGPPSSYSRSASRFGTPQPPTPPRARWGEPQPGEDAEIASLLDGSYLTRSGGQQQAPAPAADVSASRAGERPAQRYSSGPVVAAAAAAAAASCRPPPVQAPKPPPPPPPRKPEVPYASSAAAGTGDRAVAQGSGSSRGGGSGGRAFTEEDCALLRKHFHSLLCPLTHEPFVDPGAYLRCAALCCRSSAA